MLLLVNYADNNGTEFVLEVEDEYKPELVKHIRELEIEYYDLQEEGSEKVQDIWIGDYLYERLNDQDLCDELHYDFAMWDIVNID